MKKLGRLVAMAFLFATITNKSLAVSASSETSSIKDLFPFILGGLLILGVLFLGYKTDNSSGRVPREKKQKVKKSAKAKMQNKEELLPDEEAEIYAEENKADIPYEEDEGEFYEKEDNNFDYSGLNEDTEYEEDDISLFSTEEDQGSSFDDIDNDISYDVEEEPSEPDTSFDSTMVFDTDKLEELDDLEDYEEPVEQPKEVEEVIEPEAIEPEEELEYTDAVEGLDEKIASLDDLDDLDNIEVPQVAKAEEQDAQSFMNEINKYKEEIDNQEEEFVGFTTKADTKQEEDEEPEEVMPVKEKPVKRYTKKKSTKVAPKIEELPQVPEDLEYEEEQFVEEPSGQMDIGFLNQMEQNLKKNQEERMKKAGVEVEPAPEQPKKRGRKPKKQED